MLPKKQVELLSKSLRNDEITFFDLLSKMETIDISAVKTRNVKEKENLIKLVEKKQAGGVEEHNHKIRRFCYTIMQSRADIEVQSGVQEEIEKSSAKGDPMKDLALAPFLSGAASLLYSVNLHEKALNLWMMSSAIIENVHGPNHDSLVDSYENIGSLFLTNDFNEEALEYYGKLRNVLESNPPIDKKQLGNVYYQLGTIYKKQCLFDDSLKSHEKSRELFESILPRNDPVLAEVYNQIGIAYKGLGM